MNPTPDSLRALGDGFATGEILVWVPQLYRHADAWDMDKKHEELWRETVEKQDVRIMELENENVALRERIEELQWDIEELAGGGY